MHLHGPMQGAVRVCGKGKVIKACYGDVPADVDTSVVEDGVEGLRHYVIDANNCVEVGVIVNKLACFLVDIIGNVAWDNKLRVIWETVLLKCCAVCLEALIR